MSPKLYLSSTDHAKQLNLLDMNALWGHKTMPEDRHKHLIEETEATISETRRLLLFFRTAQEQALEKLERLEAVLARLKKEAEEQRLEEVGR